MRSQNDGPAESHGSSATAAPPALECALASLFAGRLRDERFSLAAQWLARIASRPTRGPAAPPSERMIDDMPALIDGIAWYLEHPDAEIGRDSHVIGVAMELGTLRNAQGFDAYDILEEYALLGHILFDFLRAAVDTSSGECDAREMLTCGYRLFRAISLIEITTTTHFIRLGHERVAEREGRLRAFNRAVSHEVRNRIGAVINAGELLRDPGDAPPQQVRKFADIVTRNAQEMRITVENLLVLARLEDDTREHRHLPLRLMAQEVSRQVRAMADGAHVDVQIAENLPDVEVNAAARLLLANYVTNAIKYRDPEAEHPTVRVEATVETADNGELALTVRVLDNGLGVAPEKRQSLFQRFFRAHAETHEHGTGLGLSIVRETARALGGKAWADFPEKGSTFAFAIPCRKRDAAPSARPRQERRQQRAGIG